MKSVGIICEYNPFHRGHAYLIDKARESGADIVVSLMSGYFTERGEAALFDPFTRAETALLGGADLVLELPFPFCSSSAEFFALAGVRIFNRLSVDEVWFGSESCDLALLDGIADVADSPDFIRAYTEMTASSDGTAQSYFSLLRDFCGNSCELLPNDILAVQYLRALKKTGSAIRPKAVRRLGGGYREKTLSDDYPSAMALREKILQGELSGISPSLPDGASEILLQAIENQLAPARLQYAERFILGRLRTMEKEEAKNCAELSGGLFSRLIDLSAKATTLEELERRTATKKYPLSHIRRGILFALLGITKEDLVKNPSYVRLLAANAKGRNFLANLPASSIPIVTRNAEIPISSARESKIERQAETLFTLCLEKPRESGCFLRFPPVIKS